MGEAGTPEKAGRSDREALESRRAEEKAAGDSDARLRIEGLSHPGDSDARFGTVQLGPGPR
jgi:hypothetical protein